MGVMSSRETNQTISENNNNNKTINSQHHQHHHSSKREASAAADFMEEMNRNVHSADNDNTEARPLESQNVLAVAMDAQLMHEPAGGNRVRDGVEQVASLPPAAASSSAAAADIPVSRVVVPRQDSIRTPSAPQAKPIHQLNKPVLRHSRKLKTASTTAVARKASGSSIGKAGSGGASTPEGAPNKGNSSSSGYGIGKRRRAGGGHVTSHKRARQDEVDEVPFFFAALLLSHSGSFFVP